MSFFHVFTIDVIDGVFELVQFLLRQNISQIRKQIGIRIIIEIVGIGDHYVNVSVCCIYGNLLDCRHIVRICDSARCQISDIVNNNLLFLLVEAILFHEFSGFGIGIILCAGSVEHEDIQHIFFSGNCHVDDVCDKENHAGRGEQPAFIILEDIVKMRSDSFSFQLVPLLSGIAHALVQSCVLPGNSSVISMIIDSGRKATIPLILPENLIFSCNMRGCL